MNFFHVSCGRESSHQFYCNIYIKYGFAEYIKLFLRSSLVCCCRMINYVTCDPSLNIPSSQDRANDVASGRWRPFDRRWRVGDGMSAQKEHGGQRKVMEQLNLEIQLLKF